MAGRSLGEGQPAFPADGGDLPTDASAACNAVRAPAGVSSPSIAAAACTVVWVSKSRRSELGAPAAAWCRE
jgi:hypothetical protein